MTFLDHPFVFSSIVAALLAVAFYLDALTWSERPDWVAISVALVWFVSVATVLQVFRMIAIAKMYERDGRPPLKYNPPALPDPPPEPDVTPNGFRRLPNLGKVDRLYATATRHVIFAGWPERLTTDKVRETIFALIEHERATHDALNHLSRPEVAQVKSFLRSKGWGVPEGVTVVLTDEGRVALRRLRDLVK